MGRRLLCISTNWVIATGAQSVAAAKATVGLFMVPPNVNIDNTEYNNYGSALGL